MKMSLTETIDSEWRSTDSNSDIGHDQSVNETNREEYDLPDERNSDKPSSNTLCNNQNHNENDTVVVVGDRLLDAMKNLHIASVKKLQPSRDPIMYDHLEMKHRSNAAMKLLSTQSVVTKAVSPLLLPKLDTRVKMSTNLSTSKHIVKTISNAANGVHLKEERIKFFGIPVTTNRKKRTQVKPFNFQSRMKQSQQSQEPCATLTVSSKSACSFDNATMKMKTISERSPNKTKISGVSNIPRGTIVSQNIEPTVSEVGPRGSQKFSHRNITLRKCGEKVSGNNTRINKENNILNHNIIGSQEMKLKRTGVGSKLHSNRRQQFEAKIKERELEIEQMRANVEQKKRDKEKFGEITSKKRLEMKAKTIPAFSIPGPTRSIKHPT